METVVENLREKVLSAKEIMNNEYPTCRKIDLYPNPATEYINLKLTSDIEIEDLDFSIHSLIGNEMPIAKENISDDEIRFNINNYNKGFYFLFISNQDSNNRKILKFSKN